MPKVIITGKSFKEKRICERTFEIHPTNFGNLTIEEIAAIEGIAVQTVRNKIARGLYKENPILKKCPRIKNANYDDTKIKNKILNIGSWEQEQLMKG